MNLGLDILLCPMSTSDFLAGHWESSPLHQPRDDPDHFRDLFKPEDVDGLLHYGGHQFIEIPTDGAQPGRVLRGLPPDPRPGSPRIALSEVRAMTNSGKTLLLHSLQRSLPAVAELARDVECRLQSPVNVNMYFTPPNSQGFAAHFDDHDVFIAQIAGHKRWRLYPTVRELPLKFETLMRSDDEEVPPDREYKMLPGDTLYLPRGTIHEAFTEADDYSLHLTVGVEVLRWVDVLIKAVHDAAREHLPLRRALPPGWLSDPTPDLSDKAGELIRWAADHVDGRAALAAVGRDFIANLAELPDRTLVGERRNVPVNADSWLQRRRDVLGQVSTDQDTAILRFPGNTLQAPAVTAAALRFAATTAAPFRAHDLPGKLTDNAKMVLLRRLVRVGFLQVLTHAERRS